MSAARQKAPPEMLREVGLDLEPRSVNDVDDVPRELPSAPEFPVDTMPVGCRAVVREASDAIGCAPEFVALPTLAVARAVAEGAPERVEPPDVMAAMALIDYSERMARRAYAAIRDGDPLAGLAEDLARFLELRGGEWSGEPTELYSQPESRPEPHRINEFGKMVRAAVRRQAVLTFDDGHGRVSKPDGSAAAVA